MTGRALRGAGALLRASLPLAAVAGVVWSVCLVLALAIGGRSNVDDLATVLVATAVTVTLTTALALIVLAAVLIALGEVTTWLIEGRRLRWVFDPDETDWPAIELKQELAALARYYVSGRYEPDLRGWAPEVTRATWPRLAMLLSFVFAAFYGLVEAAASASTQVIAWLPVTQFSAEAAVSAISTVARSMPMAFFAVSSVVVALTCGGLAFVPHRARPDRILAILTYLVVGTFWFAALYQSGSAAGVLTFAVWDGSSERVEPLNFFDAAYFAVGTMVTAGGSGVTPVSSATRLLIMVQFIVLGMVVYWLFQRRDTTEPPTTADQPSAPVRADLPPEGSAAADPPPQPAGLDFVWSEGSRAIGEQLDAARDLDDKIGRLLTLVSAGLVGTFGVALTARIEEPVGTVVKLSSLGLLVVLAYLVLAFRSQQFAYAPALPALIEWTNAEPTDIRAAFLANLQGAYIDNLDAYSIKGFYLRWAEWAFLATVLVTVVFFIMGVAK